MLKTQIVVFVLLSISFQGLAGATDTGKSQKSPLPQSRGSSEQIHCVEQAAKKINDTGRPYPNHSETSSDVWLGGQLLQVPRGYLLMVNYGTSHLGGPGVSATLETRLPDLAPHRRGEKPTPSVDGLPDNVTIYLKCSPKLSAESLTRRSRFTENSALGMLYGKTTDQLYSRELLDIGLIEYTLRPDLPYFDALYFPVDGETRDPHGGVLSIWCGQREPKPKPRVSCRVRFPLREGISVMYDFPRQQLKHWRKVHKFVVELIQSSLQEI